MKPGFNWIETLSVPAQKAMIAAASFRSVMSGTVLIQQGDCSAQFFQIVSGRIRQYMLTSDGSEVLVYLYSKGDVIGDSVIVDRDPYPVNIAAHGPTRLRVWSLRKFEPIRAQFPEINAALALQMSKRLRTVLKRMNELSTLSVAERLAQRLLSLAEITGDNTLHISQADLALAAGTTRQTVNQVISDLRRQGLISSGYGWIAIENTRGLRHYLSGI